MTKFKNIVSTLVALVISVTAINARTVNRTNTFLAERPFTVIYIGNEGDYLLFRVIFNAEHTASKFEISDKQEGEIYTADINSAHKEQTLKIEKKENQELDFKLVIGNDVYSRSFAIL
ncbi:MAG: hypothetical protein H7Z13_03010 [Ferruginibacter sp.]|nr:hypothetical protein [Ferruginibacter sp.]